MEKEYTVVVHKGVDLAELEAEITSSTGAGPIPNRSISITNPRPSSTRQTHFLLTDEEAVALEADARILAVEIPPDQRTDIKIGFRSIQTANFTKPTSLDNATYVNWGLRRSLMESNLYGSKSTTDNEFQYALTGKGVDIVIQDSGIEPNHPDFLDSNGVSRVKPIDWYAAQSVVSGTQSANYDRDLDGHGTLCASISAGNVYGFAKDANLYSMKIAGLEGPGDNSGTSVTDCFDLIKEWHKAKTNGRPTVVNMSWGYLSSQTSTPDSGNYRGTPWSWEIDYNTDAALWQGTGVVAPVQGENTRILPVRVASVDADVDELISAGVHVVVAAGNDYYKGDLSTGVEYNNSVTFGASTIFYARGSSPHSDDAFIVGSIDTSVQQEGSIYKDKTANSSSRGPRVNIWAPGTNIVGAVSTTTTYTTQPSPIDASYKIGINSGTSFAAPQVAGVVALHLESLKDSTPSQIKTKMLSEAKPVMYDTASDTDYTSFSTSLLGASNKVLFDKYGRQPLTVSGQNLTLQGASPRTT